jgi:SAM-dependent methyltransferase
VNPAIQVPFDASEYVRINQCRERWLTKALSLLPFRSRLKTALDLGCGAGYFSSVLARAGFQVTGLDLRQSNVELCRQRYPGCTFGLINLDDTSQLIPDIIGRYDLVLMFGLLYHLESPLQVISRLAPCIGEVAFVGTRVAQGTSMACYLHQEFQGDDQGKASCVAVPTFPAVTAMFAISGFSHIYLPDFQPEHPQWDPAQFQNGLRKQFIVSREPLTVPGFQLVQAPEPIRKWEPMQ